MELAECTLPEGLLRLSLVVSLFQYELTLELLVEEISPLTATQMPRAT